MQVNRERAQRLVILQTNVQGRDLGGFAEEVQRTVAERVDVPPGVFLVYGGEFENQRRAMGRLGIVVPLALGIILVLVFATLRSWKLTGLVLVIA